MACIRPFKGYRPKKDLAKNIASYPYDVVSSEEAREIAKNNQYSFFHVVKPEIDLDPKIDLYSPVVYDTAKKNLEMFIEKGWLIQDEKDCFYVYRQNMNGHEQYGLVVTASCDDYDNGIIKKHEFTRPDKEDDRFRHVYTTGANGGPVFLTYRPDGGINQMVSSVVKSEKPLYDFVADDGISHTVWQIKDSKLISELITKFKKVDYLYVADGHHRAASGSRTRKAKAKENKNHRGDEGYNYFLAVLFPSDQLKVLAYNRVVEDLAGKSPSEILKGLSEVYELVSQGVKVPPENKMVSVYLEKKWYLFKDNSDKSKYSSPEEGLDVAVLQSRILAPLLKIDDPRTNSRIKFIGGIRGTDELEKLVDSGKYKIAFSLYPTSVDEIMSVADVSKVMPPKSTWFEPKLRSGLIVHKF